MQITTNKEFDRYQTATSVKDLPSTISKNNELSSIGEVGIPLSLRGHVTIDALDHRNFNTDEFWKKIPAFKNVSREEFNDVKFQNKNTASKIDHLDNLLEGIVSKDFLDDVRKGMQLAPMNLRLSPYILSLINWDNPYTDPLRIQFIPVGKTKLPDHPKLTLDSLSEQQDSPVEGLVHRYYDKALFLPLDVCPVYCAFCTRSYAIGSDTDQVSKQSFKPIPDNWNRAFAYIASRPELEDIVISGGDTYMLRPQRIRQIGEHLLAIPHVRRLRFATKGPAVLPMKILSDTEWTNALVDVVQKGRELSKEVVLHTHFNHQNEITDITRQAMDLLFKHGVKIRNQSVLIRGVNDNADEMIKFIRKLSFMNIQPYYIYQHDMVPGTEQLRTRVKDALELERKIRGATAGFNTPTIVTDAPGGGGKRDVHSYDYYDEVSGISVYRSPSVNISKLYLYFDPVHLLPEEGQQRWANPDEHDKMVKEAVEKSGLNDYSFN